MSKPPRHMFRRRRVAIDVTKTIETNLCMRCFIAVRLARDVDCVPEPYSFDDEDDRDDNHEFNFLRLEDTNDPYRYEKKCKYCNTHLHNRASRPDCRPDWQKEMIDRHGKHGARRHIARMESMLHPSNWYEEIDEEARELDDWKREWDRIIEWERMGDI